MLRTVVFLCLFSSSLLRAEAAGDSADGWGYGYDSLLNDLERWRESPYATVDSIGSSVQGRAIWMVTITGGVSESGVLVRKRRVFMHARTHPAEVQANHIANETIRLLLDSGSASRELRRDFIFNIVPMYNPDGVELGRPRENAHGVDLEGNWDKLVLEPEVTALKRQFLAFMSGPVPIEVALNLHSDLINCTRFFFFHYAAGTSPAYEDLQRKFIGRVQGRFPEGIEDWDYVRSWDNGTQLRYPEGFWWANHREEVLALTYEDANCENAGGYDSTARALAMGSADYIRDRAIAGTRPLARARFQLLADGIRIPMGATIARWDLTDMRGRRLAGGPAGPGDVFLAWNDLPESSLRILSLTRAGFPTERMRLPPGR